MVFSFSVGFKRSALFFFFPALGLTCWVLPLFHFQPCDLISLNWLLASCRPGLASVALGCGWQTIGIFHLMLLGAGMVPLGIAAHSAVAGTPSKPGWYAVHTTGATSPGTEQMTETHTQCMLLPAVPWQQGSPGADPWMGSENQAQSTSLTGFICRHRCLWSSAETHHMAPGCCPARSCSWTHGSAEVIRKYLGDQDVFWKCVCRKEC